MELISARFQDLLAEAATGDAGGKSLAAGQMLLLCINGLFDKMESGLASLTLAFDRGLAADPSLQPRLEPLRTARLTLVRTLCVLLGFHGFYGFLLSFTGFYWVLLGVCKFLLGFTGCLQVLTGFIWILLDISWFYWVNISFYWVLLSFCQFYFILLGFIGFLRFLWVSISFYLVLPGFTGFY